MVTSTQNISYHDGISLSRDIIESLFVEIGERLAASGHIAEISVYGGSAIALMFDFRNATQDVDFMPVSGDLHLMQQIANEIGSRDGLPDGWMSDAVEIFASDHHEFNLQGEYPPENPGLRVFTATPEYILAMKVMSMRSSLAASDVKDVWHLIDECGIGSAEDALVFVSKFYPEKRVPLRNRHILMDIFEAKQSGAPYSASLGW